MPRVIPEEIIEEGGSVGTPGTPGTDGVDGVNYRGGALIPDNSDGNEGDTFVIDGTGEIYRHESGVWTSTGEFLKGEDGGLVRMEEFPSAAVVPPGLGEGPVVASEFRIFNIPMRLTKFYHMPVGSLVSGTMTASLSVGGVEKLVSGPISLSGGTLETVAEVDMIPDVSDALLVPALTPIKLEVSISDNVTPSLDANNVPQAVIYFWLEATKA